jgi:hypothetical protein
MTANTCSGFQAEVLTILPVVCPWVFTTGEGFFSSVLAGIASLLACFGSGFAVGSVFAVCGGGE